MFFSNKNQTIRRSEQTSAKMSAGSENASQTDDQQHVLQLQRQIGNKATQQLLSRHPAANPKTLQREITLQKGDKFSIADSDERTDYTSFGDWVYARIKLSAESEEWRYENNGNMLYLWTDEKEDEYGKVHCQGSEHLHLINKGTEVVIVFTYTGGEKNQNWGKLHSGGNKDENQYTLSGGKIPQNIANTPQWLVDLAHSLQSSVRGWANEDTVPESFFQQYKG